MTNTTKSSENSFVKSEKGLKNGSNTNFESMIILMNQIYQTTQFLNNFGVALPPTTDIQLRMELHRILQTTFSYLTLLKEKLNEVKYVGRVIKLNPITKYNTSAKKEPILSLSKNSITISKSKIVSNNPKNVVISNSPNDDKLKDAALTLLSLSECPRIDITTPSQSEESLIDSNVHEVYKTLHSRSDDKSIYEVYPTLHTNSRDKNVFEVYQKPQLHFTKYVNVKVDSPLRTYPTSIIGVTRMMTFDTDNNNKMTSVSFTKSEIMKLFGLTIILSPKYDNLMEWKDIRLKVNNVPYIVRNVVQDVITFVPLTVTA